MPFLKRPKKPQDVYQEYEALKDRSSSKKVSPKKRLVLAALLILVGSFTNAAFFNSSASAIKKTDAKQVVNCAYQTFLGRAPDKNGAKFWQNYYTRSNYDPSDLAHQLLSTNEGQKIAYLGGFDTFISRMYQSCLGSKSRAATATDISTWKTKNINGLKKEDIFAFVINTEGKPFNLPRVEQCSKFPYPRDAIKPVCKLNSGGYSSDVVTTQVSGSNIIVNDIWLKNITDLRNEALKSGYNLQAYQDPRVPYSAGSYRSAAAQKWLREHGYPVSREETSMHEWGLAIDFTCNGTPLGRTTSCLSWVRQNAPRFGAINRGGEAWHWSPNDK